MQASDLWSQFNSGEMSPLIEGRLDFAKYKNGCRTLENFIPTVQGPAKRRQGSRYVATTKNPGERVWLRPFQASNIENYVLEFGSHYVRFYTNHGILLDGGGTYELSTPYSTADLTTADGTCALQFAQSNDVLYIVHAKYAPAKLTRTGVGTFTFTTNTLGVSKTGPFKDVNADQSILVTASGDGVSAADKAAGVNTGDLSDPYITLTASTGIFLDGMVGKYFYLQEGRNILLPQWEPGKGIVVGDVRRYNSLNYIAVNAATTGNSPPTHLEGTRFDGNTGVDWLFTDDGFGVVLITSLVGAQPTNVVTATVVKRLPFSNIGVSTHRWAAAAWTIDEGFPDSICFFRERSVFGRGQSLWFSVAGDFENFATTFGGQQTADSAIIMTLAADKKDRILWLQPDTSLIAGTATGEYAISEYSNGSVLGPANIRAQRQSAFGSRAIKPLAISASNLFVERGGRRVREMSFDIRQSQYLSVDVTVLAEHITKAGGISPSQTENTFDGILDWTFALRPDHVVWAARADGILLGFTYNREQDVTAWHRHRIGYQTDGGGEWGEVESVCAIASPDGTQEDLWLVVKRGDYRHVEWIGKPLQTEILNTPWGGGQISGIRNELALSWQELQSTALWELDAFYVDGGLSRLPSTRYENPNSPDTVTAVSGLDHLEGLTVQVVVDGSPHKDKIVTGGRITLDAPAYTVHVGCKAPAILETGQVNVGAQDGTAQGKIKRQTWVTARFFESKGGYIGASRSKLEQLRYRTARAKMNSYIPFFTGDERVDWPGGFEEQSRMYVLQDSAFPMTVVALIPQLVTRERP